MLERFVAGIVVIGLLLWGASILATPEHESADAIEPDARADALPTLGEPVARSDAPLDERRDDEEDDGEDDEEEDRRGKKKGGD